MAPVTFNDTVEFAISREKEAVQFYIDLQVMAKFAGQKELLKEFENMERGHVTLLEGVRDNQEPARLSKSVPADIHLDDYLVASPPTGDMTYQDILITAIKREKKSATLYTRLRDDSNDEAMKDVFNRLAVEEENHRNFFEKLYDRDIQGDN